MGNGTGKRPESMVRLRKITFYSVILTGLAARHQAKDLRTAWSLYVQSRDFFMSLTETHGDQIYDWYKMDRAPKEFEKDVQSVYKHEIPNRKSIPEYDDPSCLMGAR